MINTKTSRLLNKESDVSFTFGARYFENVAKGILGLE